MPTVLWQFSKGRRSYGERTVVMGIVNATPDSFSDGGQFAAPGAAMSHSAKMVEDGADILDVGGESTRPGGTPVTAQMELDRVIPLVEQLVREFDVPVSVDTTKTAVARAALAAGAEIINDISGLRFEPELANIAAEHSAGLILMHSRGELATLHQQPTAADVFADILTGLVTAIDEAERRGVPRPSIVLDPGIGFGKSLAQNLALVANFRRLVEAFPEFLWLAGTSRKSFIGRVLGDAPVERRLNGTLATLTAAVLGGARIVRVHDVKEAAETVRLAEALRDAVVMPFN